MSPKTLLTVLLLNIPLIGLFLYDVIKIGLGEGSTTSFTAHLGGIVTGLTLGICLIRNYNVQKWENILKYVCGIIFILFSVSLFFCQFASFDMGFTGVSESSGVGVPILTAGAWNVIFFAFRMGGGFY